MIVVDTSALLALSDHAHPQHAATAAALQNEPGPYLVSPFVVAETDYLLAVRRGTDDELAFLRQVASGGYRLELFGADDLARASDLVARYRDLGLGIADASIVVIADRADTTRLLTFDERHFRVVRPIRGTAFTLLPADA